MCMCLGYSTEYGIVRTAAAASHSVVSRSNNYSNNKRQGGNDLHEAVFLFERRKKRIPFSEAADDTPV